MGELDGKVAVITGAGSGMARACARVFVREGARPSPSASGSNGSFAMSGPVMNVPPLTRIV